MVKYSSLRRHSKNIGPKNVCYSSTIQLKEALELKVEKGLLTTSLGYIVMAG